MKPASFTYVAPDSVDELTQILAARYDIADIAILAGGQSLMPLMALRHALPTTVVDINGLEDELGEIQADGDGLRLGALVRQRSAERDSRIHSELPLLAEALPLCARPAIRTRGTIGGSVAHADPAAEIPVVALALNATMIAHGPTGERGISAADFFVGAHSTAMAPNEFLSAVVFPTMPAGSGTSFLELSLRHADRAIVAVAVTLSLTDGCISEPRIALAGVGATPVRAAGAEAELAGCRPDQKALQAAAAIAAQDIDPDSDLRAPAAYRRHATSVLVRRALSRAVERAGGTL